MVHRREAVVQTVRLGQAQLQPREQFIVVGAVVPKPQRALAVLAHVAAEPHDFARLELAQDRALEFVQRQVQVAHVAAAHDVAQEAHRVRLVVGLVLRGRVDDADGPVQQVADIFCAEAQGREALFDMVDLVLVHKLKVERCGRLAVAAAQEAVDPAEHRLLFGLEGVLALAGGDHRAQPGRAGLQALVEHAVHGGGVRGLVRLVERILGHDAVLAHDVDEHVPLAAVVHARAQNVGDGAVVCGQAGRLQNALQEIVAALKLVPEGQIALRQLEGLQVLLLGNALAQHVERGKQPAAAAGLLVGDLQRLDLQGELLTHRLRACADEGHVVQVALGQRAGGQTALRTGGVGVGPYL